MVSGNIIANFPLMEKLSKLHPTPDKNTTDIGCPLDKNTIQFDLPHIFGSTEMWEMWKSFPVEDEGFGSGKLQTPAPIFRAQLNAETAFE